MRITGGVLEQMGRVEEVRDAAEDVERGKCCGLLLAFSVSTLLVSDG